MSDWYTGFEKDMIRELKGQRRSDLRFFRIEEYLKMAEIVDGQADACRECQAFRQRMESRKTVLVKAVGEPGKERRELDRLQVETSDHLRRLHGFYPESYFTYRYSFFLTAAMLSVAFLLYLLSPSSDIWYFLAPAFTVGVIAGQIAGGKKDRRIRETGKLL